MVKKRSKVGTLREAVSNETLELWQSEPKPNSFLRELQREDLGDLTRSEGATPSSSIAVETVAAHT
eukprot:COSAG04_NODE_5384_length_1634_cov_2.297068_2_plen_66_part_00